MASGFIGEFAGFADLLNDPCFDELWLNPLKPPATRPSRWFAAHNNRKPSISVKANNDSLNAISSHISRNLEDLGFSYESVVYFLYKYLLDIKKVKLTEKWESYGVVIGEIGEEIGPLDLLEVEVSQFDESLVSGVQVPVDALAYGLLAIHRVIRIEDANHLAKVSREINNELSSKMGSNLKIALNLSKKLTGWQHKDLNKLVAAVDMFFHKFPNHEKAFLRNSTSESRYRCCAALTSYEFLKDYIGASEGPDMRSWIWTPLVAREVERMFKGNEEFSKIDSYFPYQVDFNLVFKTAYSSVENKHLFLFLHMVGSMLGSKISINAKLHIKYCVDIISVNALVMSYAYSEPKMVQGAEKPLGDNMRLKAANQLDPDKWIKYCKKDKIPSEIQEFGKRCINHLQNARKGTIGEYTKNYLEKL